MSRLNKHNTEKYISRLISGITYIYYKKELFEIRPPTVNLQQKAAIYYDMVVKTCKFERVAPEKSFMDYCVRRELIPPDYEDIISNNTKIIEELKIALYKAGPRKTTANQIRQKLNAQRDGQNKFLAKIYEYKQNTIEGLANHAKKIYVFINSIYDKNSNKVFDEENIDSQLFNHLSYHYNSELLDETEVREVARSYGWRSIWNSAQTNIFQNSLTELTEEQKLILTYSELYDFAHKCTPAPGESIINDDDVFDGWYLNEIKRIKDEQAGRATDDKFGKFDPKAQEIYVVAQDQEEANSIYDANTEESKKILKDRSISLKTNSKVKQVDLPDVQRELKYKALEGFKNKFKK